jgi:hypothetical protein
MAETQLNKRKTGRVVGSPVGPPRGEGWSRFTRLKDRGSDVKAATNISREGATVIHKDGSPPPTLEPYWETLGAELFAHVSH